MFIPGSVPLAQFWSNYPCPTSDQYFKNWVLWWDFIIQLTAMANSILPQLPQTAGPDFGGIGPESSGQGF